MDQKLEHSIASASTEDADPEFSDLHYSSSSSSKADSDAFRSSDDNHSSDDSSFMENHQKNHLYIRQSTTMNTYMIWFKQMEADILRVVHRSRIEPNFWTSLSAEKRQQFM